MRLWYTVLCGKLAQHPRLSLSQGVVRTVCCLAMCQSARVLECRTVVPPSAAEALLLIGSTQPDWQDSSPSGIV